LVKKVLMNTFISPSKNKLAAMKIDRLNIIILKELLKDGRKSFAEIAKENKTSKEVIANRYKQMKKQGIIVGSTIQTSLNYYDSNFAEFFFIKSVQHEEDNVFRLITKMPKVISVFHGSTDQNTLAIFAIKNVQEIEQLKQSIKGIPYVLEVETRQCLGARNTPHNLSVLTNENNIQVNNNIQQVHGKHQKFDEIDKFIFEEFAENSRIPFSEIAKNLGLSTDTISRRYEILKQNGNLKAIIQINPIKIGYPAYAVFNLSFSQENAQNNLAAICSIPDINLINKMSGRFDYMVSIMIRDINQFISVQDQILKMTGLIKFEMLIAKMFPVWPTPKEIISTF
jgi:Lrp/AsnC family transcriptional regulator for asnA, asnC and gidA